MRLTVIIFLFSFLCFQKQKKVIFFGDSLTELGVKPGGYVSRIDSTCKAEGLSANFLFEGSGISGQKVYDLYLRLEEDILSKSPDIVVVLIGVNDVWHKRLFGTGTDADRFERIYQRIIDKMKTKGIKIILCTPPAIGEKTDYTNELDGDLNKYSSIIRKLAIKNDLTLIDLRSLFLKYNLEHNKDNKESGILTYDKVHLNSKGNELLAREMWNAIKRQQ
jgi:lysophospholipase L1-like esterase